MTVSTGVSLVGTLPVAGLTFSGRPFADAWATPVASGASVATVGSIAADQYVGSAAAAQPAATAVPAATSPVQTAAALLMQQTLAVGAQLDALLASLQQPQATPAAIAPIAPPAVPAPTVPTPVAAPTLPQVPALSTLPSVPAVPTLPEQPVSTQYLTILDPNAAQQAPVQTPPLPAPPAVAQQPAAVNPIGAPTAQATTPTQSPISAAAQALLAQAAAVKAQLDALLAQLTGQTTPAPSAPQTISAPGPSTTATPAKQPDPEPSPIAKKGANGEAVKKIESRLKGAGFDVGKEDGYFDGALENAVKAFQKKNQMKEDGIVTGDSWKILDILAKKGDIGYGLSREALLANENNQWKGSKNNCYSYAWEMVNLAGGFDRPSKSKVITDGRNEPTMHLQTLVDNGTLQIGDVIYINYHPGKDPRSIDLANGPHWFVYVGEGQYADQYGIKTLEEMNRFTPNRFIDEIYHPSQPA